MTKTFYPVVLTALLFSSCIMRRPPYKAVPGGLSDLAGHEQEVIHMISELPADSTIKLYTADEHSMDSLFGLSQKQYTVFYIGSNNADLNFFFRLAKYMERHNEHFDFIPMFTFGDGAGYTYDFLRWEQYYRPAFVPDSTKYAAKSIFQPIHELLPTIERICPECETEDMWMHSLFVFERGKFLCQTRFSMNKFEYMEMIEKLPLEKQL